VVEFAAFAGAALIVDMDGGPRRSATRRLGVACGVAVGGLFLVRPIRELLHPGDGPAGGPGSSPVAQHAGPGRAGDRQRLDRALGVGDGPHSGVGGAGHRRRLDGRVILASVTSVQSLNDRTANAAIWFAFRFLSAGNGLVVGLMAPALGGAAQVISSVPANWSVA
jgi:hypothetical protein